MARLLSIPLVVLLASFVLATGQEIGTEICSCSPRTYEITLDFSLTCPPVNITLGNAIEATSCLVSPFGAPNVVDLVPVSVDSIDVLELGQNLRVVAQTDIDDVFVDGDTFTYTSVVADPDSIDTVQQVPRAIQLNIVGTNKDGEQIINVFIVTFTNDCGSYPLFEEGESAGWARFTGLGPGSPELCSAIAPSPTDPSLVLTTSPVTTDSPVSPTMSPMAPVPSPTIISNPVATGPTRFPMQILTPTDVPVQNPTDAPVPSPTVVSNPVATGPTRFPMQILTPTDVPVQNPTDAPVSSSTVVSNPVATGPTRFPMQILTPTNDPVPSPTVVSNPVATGPTRFPMQILTPTNDPVPSPTVISVPSPTVVSNPDATGPTRFPMQILTPTNTPTMEIPEETGSPIEEVPVPVPSTVAPVVEELPTDAQVDPTEAPVEIEDEIDPTEAPVEIEDEIDPTEAPVEIENDETDPTEAPVEIEDNDMDFPIIDMSMSMPGFYEEYMSMSMPPESQTKYLEFGNRRLDFEKGYRKKRLRK